MCRVCGWRLDPNFYRNVALELEYYLIKDPTMRDARLRFRECWAAGTVQLRCTADELKRRGGVQWARGGQGGWVSPRVCGGALVQMLLDQSTASGPGLAGRRFWSVRGMQGVSVNEETTPSADLLRNFPFRRRTYIHFTVRP